MQAGSGGWRRLVAGLRRLRRVRRERAALAGSRAFDARWYAETYPDAAGHDPVRHYLEVRDGRRPSPWFDAQWYLERYPDLATSGLDPLAHYILYGAKEGRDPSAWFATRWYAANNPPAAKTLTPLDHYLASDPKEPLDPSPGFDAAWYATVNPEVAESGLDPLGHFLLIGRQAGLRPEPLRPKSPGEPVTAARLQTFKALEPVKGAMVALFVAHAPDGRLKPNVQPYVEALAACGVKVVLIAAADGPFTPDPALTPVLAGGYVRENRGYDFAAWAHLMQAEPSMFGAEILFLVNDSVIASGREGVARLVERVRKSKAEVIGATESREFGWHLQSFFIAFKGRALAYSAIHRFFGAVRGLADKNEVIRRYEVTLSRFLQEHGLACEALFANLGSDNPTMFRWRELLDAGFPFVKTLLVSGAAPDSDISDWQETLAAHGFDVALAEATVAARAEPAHTEPPLATGLLRARDVAPPSPPWKVAFIGPWNYASGLGLAGRGYLSALWRTGARLNLHPIERPFHTHARLTPMVTARDFEGDADIALIHMNPDAWGALTEAQQAVIANARLRIGVWVWEMGHVPDFWRPNFDAVDAIWTPSRYCAEVFAAQTEAPVTVVPHVVPVPPPGEAADRAAVLAELGLPADARVILYAFDAASYLVRKNPSALVRAFAASGLQKRGWRLVLKTKNMFDEPTEGAALDRLAKASAGVTLINGQLSLEAMTALFEAADIYASPHRSEGFGLTVAEAMALGKPVVASDYGGTRDFLDASCGYPVPARTVRLDKDFGAYRSGGEWGEIDEAALAETLRRAAEAVERGDDAIGRAARARIAERLSADAVGTAMTAGFERALRDGYRAPKVSAAKASAA